MQIKTKLLLLVLLLGFALVVNLTALGFLTRTINLSLKTIEEVSIRQQLIASQMHAQLREAEAALYRYLREGESGFVIQFEDQLQNFELDVTTYQALVSNEEERVWAAELAVAHQNAVGVGNELIQLRDQQTADLQQLEGTQTALTELLSGEVRAARPDDVAYQEAVSGMHTHLREMLLAITAYLASPVSTERVRLTEAAIGFSRHHNQFSALANTNQELTWVEYLAVSFSEVQALGSRIVSGRDQQDAQFANFAAILFSTGQGILVGEIQPQAAENLALAQEELLEARNFSVAASLVTAISVSILAAVVTLPLLRQMSTSSLALLQGADRVTAGDLTKPVSVSGRDELSRLAEAFNTMMTELAAREQHLKARLSDLEAQRQVSLQLTSSLDMDRVLDTTRVL